MSKKAPRGPWYRQPRERAHEAVYARVSALRNELAAWRDHALFLMQLRAGSEDISGDGLHRGEDGRLRYNLASSTVDTAQSLIAASRPLPQCVVKGGDWKKQRKAKLRTRTLQSQALEMKLYQLFAQAHDDACTAGIGAIHFLADTDTGLPSAERVHPLQLVWDRTEASNGQLRSLFRLRLIDREVLRALYKDHAELLSASDGPSFQDLRDFALQRNTKCDQVVVYEAWHLPSSSKADDGKHVICTNNATLLLEDWKRPRFPMSFFRWAPRQVGFLGRSLVEEVRPAQRRIHSLIEFVEECQDLGSVPRVWLEEGGHTEPDELDNRPMGIGFYRGQPPIFNTFEATPQDLQAEIDRIREQTWSMLGLTQSQVQGERPAGVTSAVGMRTMDDIGSRRHAMNLRWFEDSVLESFLCLSDLNDDVAERDPGFVVRRQTRGRFLETSKWAELKIPEGDLSVSVFPVSALPTTPAGRYQQLEEWIQAGWIPREVAMQLLGMPDLEAYEDLNTADLRCVQWQVGRILDGEQNVLPVPQQDLLGAAEFARKSYLHELQEGAPAEVLDALDNFVTLARLLLERQQQEQAANAQPSADPMGEAAPGLVGAMSPGPAEQAPLAA